MKLETYIDAAGREWDLHKIPTVPHEHRWLARLADDSDSDGDQDKEGDSRAEVIRAIDEACALDAAALRQKGSDEQG